MSEEAPTAASGQSGAKVFTAQPTWAAIGLHLPTEERADEVLAEISDRVRPLNKAENLEVYRYDDRSGAAVVFDVVDGSIADLRQAFLSEATAEANWVELGAGFALAAIKDTSGQVVARACVAMQDGLLHQPGREKSGQLHLSALAQRAEVYGDYASYAESETAQIFAKAANDGVDVGGGQGASEKETETAPLPAFISMGAVAATSGQPAHAGIVMAGKVLGAELHSNTMTGQNFWVARVDAGFELDVCVAQNAIAGRLNKGNILAGEFALLGQAE